MMKNSNGIYGAIFQIDVGGSKREATVDDVIKIVEDLTRIH